MLQQNSIRFYFYNWNLSSVLVFNFNFFHRIEWHSNNSGFFCIFVISVHAHYLSQDEVLLCSMFHSSIPFGTSWDTDFSSVVESEANLLHIMYWIVWEPWSDDVLIAFFLKRRNNWGCLAYFLLHITFKYN